MKYTLAFTILFLCSELLANLSIADSKKKDGWEEWPRVKGTLAKRGEQILGAFHDPRKPSDILIYPGCWLIERKAKRVILANCPFKLIGNHLYFDSNWGYRPEGIEWGDPKIDDLSFFSLIFRRPNVGETTASIWDGKAWIHVDGLPELK